MKRITRRRFLKTTAAAAGAVALADLLALDLLAQDEDFDPLKEYPYRGWEELYREMWSHDSTGRMAHSVNCTGSCTWKAYVKNGVIFKEEQYGDFPPIGGDVPTYNPRGCQKGANHKEYQYGPQRVKYPLIRAGERGEGKWRRATWNEALDYIAQRTATTIERHGPDTVTFFSAIPAKHHITLAGGFRLANLIGGVICSFYDWYCDLPPGEPITWGVQTDACEAADWFNSSYIVLWGSNVLETRIPDAHFLTEARMKGARVVSISPEYSPVSIHADLHLPVKPGTDALLALAMAEVIVSEKLYDAPYVSVYTDLPFLVRKDTKRFLRESDLREGGNADRLYLWDTATGRPLAAPGTEGHLTKTLRLGKVKPALDGTFEIDTPGGRLAVTTVFSLLKEKLAAHDPVSAGKATGLDPGLIREVAREFAAAKPARIIAGAGTNHYYHNDLTNRAQILLAALTGNVGRPGGGFDHYVGQEKLWAEQGFFRLSFPHGRPRQRFQNTTLWTYVHAGVRSDVDPLWKRPVGDYIRESVERGWMPLYPKGTLETGRAPKILFVWGANYLNQAKGATEVYEKLWPKLDLVVDINFRMDTTALNADVVLPAATWAEKWDLSTTDLHSFVHPFTPVVPPQFDSRTDWQIWRGLAAALQKTGLAFEDALPDGPKLRRDFSTLASDFDRMNTDGRSLADDRDACRFLLEQSPETRGLTLEAIAERPRRFLRTSEEWTSDLKEGVPYYGFQRMYEGNRPLHTLTGRQQFYIDHEWFVEAGEELPVYKPPLEVDRYPLRWITPHGRWSIHSTWRDAKYQLRLQRGRPIVYLSPSEAEKRGLQDNERVEIANGHGSLPAYLCVSHRIADGIALMYHGWEKTFLEGAWQSPTTIRIKPTQLAGGYPQLRFRLNYWGPTGNQKDTRVEVRKAPAAGKEA
jgi:nitrate reductase / nitrite oxidoreductase, alpha subunit